MNLNIENIVRSGVALVVCLPVSLGMSNSLATSTRLTEEAAAQKDEYQELVSEGSVILTASFGIMAVADPFNAPDDI